MMSDKLDDLEAVRTIVQALDPFDPGERERIIRWASEKMGLLVQREPLHTVDSSLPGSEPTQLGAPGLPKDIKAFVAQKNPKSNNEFAATVAYYYRFVAEGAAKKESISATDLQEACRLTGRDRLTNPGQTLINAHAVGLVDKGRDRGAYCVSTVGENLVAVSLPGGKDRSTPRAGKKKARTRKAARGGRKSAPKHRSKRRS